MSKDDSNQQLEQAPKVKPCTISLPEIVEGILNEPLNGEKPSAAHRRMVQSQQHFVNSLMDAVLEHVGNGETVKIKNFGKFDRRFTKDQARNPQTGDMVAVENPARLRFTASVKTTTVINSGK